MFSGRLAAKALLFLLCGYATACAEDATADGASAEVADEETPDTLAQVAPGSCLANTTTAYDRAGPFRVSQRTIGRVKFWVPAVPTDCKVPVVHLANGTGATCGNYGSSLERIATHGFLAACYENTNTGAGQFGIDAIDSALQNFPIADGTKIGSTGHSQGGQASIITTALAEAKYPGATVAALAMQPASGFGEQPRGRTWQQVYRSVRSPVFMFSGNSSTGFANSRLLGIGVGDGLVAISWVSEGYQALSREIEAYHWTAQGATHIPTPQQAENEVAPAWFRWKLLGDQAACRYFKGLTSGRWRVKEQQNVQSCE